MAEEPLLREGQDVRPRVAAPKNNLSVWLFGAGLLAVAGGVFYALQMHRLDIKSDSLVQQSDTGGTIASPPPLVIPPNLLADASPPPMAAGMMPGMAGQAMGQGITPQGGPATAMATLPYQGPVMASTPPPQSPPAGMAGNGPAPSQLAPSGVIFQPSAGSDGPGAGNGPDGGKGDDSANAGVARVRSHKLQDPSTTVPQGSVIQAVMETALDSTRAGFARALVSRDVMSFDGSRVLIPRGSKLVGEYKADVSLGQKRALVQWRRLTLPDGTIIDVDSPAADPLGRAGVKGKVNTHFLERFSGAILQSVLDIGVRAATSEATNNTVIIGSPTTTQSSLTTQQTSIQPTLKVRQGASITVFVARDLVFS